MTVELGALSRWRRAAAAVVLLAGPTACGGEATQPRPGPHQLGLPEQVADYLRDPNPQLRQLDVREIGDGQILGVSVVCDRSEGARTRAEQGTGTERRDVGWYGSESTTINVGVTRFDWSDAARFDDYVDAFESDSACLSGEPDQTVELLGTTVPVWRARVSGRPVAGATMKITLDGTILYVVCDRGAVVNCRDFAADLLGALDVS